MAAILVLVCSQPAWAKPRVEGGNPLGLQLDRPPAEVAGKCVKYLRERSRLIAERSATLDPLLARSTTLDSALAVLALPAPQPAQAGTLSRQADALTQEIQALRSVLDGRLTEAWIGRRQSEVREQITSLERSRARKTLLARAYEAKGRERVAMLDTVRVEKQQLSEAMDAATKPYEERLTWLRQRVEGHGEAFEEAMRGFGRIEAVSGVNIQAVRVHATIAEGRLTFSWTDARGAMVASAHLWLRARRDTQVDPPLMHGRYPVLLQNRQETQISAGHFLIEFRVSTDELDGEARVLEAAERLMDIDALGRLIPLVGSNGLD